jgi:hypothetical protein
MSFIDDNTLMQVYDIVCNCENSVPPSTKE